MRALKQHYPATLQAEIYKDGCCRPYVELLRSSEHVEWWMQQAWKLWEPDKLVVRVYVFGELELTRTLEAPPSEFLARPA